MIKPLAFGMGVAASGFLLAAEAPGAAGDAAAQRALLDRYCVTCHNQAIVNLPTTPGESLLFTQLRDIGLTLDTEDVSDLAANPALWEKVVRKLRVGVMPPPDNPRPDKASYDGFRNWLETELDRVAAEQIDPGRTEAFHRLNQTEYRN